MHVYRNPNDNDTLPFKKDDKIRAKKNLSYKNSDDEEIVITKNSEYIVDGLFCSNNGDGLLVKGDKGPAMSYNFDHKFPFYYKEELICIQRGEIIDELLK